MTKENIKNIFKTLSGLAVKPIKKIGKKDDLENNRGEYLLQGVDY